MNMAEFAKSVFLVLRFSDESPFIFPTKKLQVQSLGSTYLKWITIILLVLRKTNGDRFDLRGAPKVPIFPPFPADTTWAQSLGSTYLKRITI